MKAVFLILLVILLIPIVGAEGTVLLYANTSNSLMWTYTADEPITQASLDGVIIQNFDNQSPYYAANELPQNSKHVFCIYTNTTSYCSIDVTDTPIEERVKDYFWEYMLILLAVVFVILSVWVKPFAWVAVICSLTGIIDAGTMNNFTMFIVFGIVTVVSLMSIRMD